MKRRRREKVCPECHKLVRVTKYGTLGRHSPVWKNPPSGAPLCSGSGAAVKV
jgi:hypothetical protein